MHATCRPGPRGFTLVELLVVIAIIALISAVALPTVLPALNERRVSEAARILQAILAGTRDAAIRSNSPRGIRLLPDPILNPLAPNASPGVLASNRVIPIEMGPDYTEGLVSAVTQFLPNTQNTPDPIYSIYGPNYLILAQSPFISVGVPNTPTSWSLNVRQGDKIRFNDSGAYYTIAGPINGAPFGTPVMGPLPTVPGGGPLPPGVKVLNNPQFNGNSERVIACFPAASTPFASQSAREFLFLTNGIDDNGNGWVDESCDGVDNDGDGTVDPGFNGIDDNGDGYVDEPAELFFGNEFEQEAFIGSQASNPPVNEAYTIVRRPVVSPGAREVTLPAGIVIDLTTWNASVNGVGVLPERSRLPVDPFTSYVDIMIDQTGRVVSTGAGTSGGNTYANSPLSSIPFYHFWLTEREGVVAPTLPAKGSATNPMLPMPSGTPNYPAASGPSTYLTGERRLVTLFAKTGQIVSNSIQNFNGANVNVPFYDAQSGTKEPQ